jgi:nucleotide-binding universal stress UspA family protein
MYRRILVALNNAPADASLLAHVGELARQIHAQLLLLHVADGWAARNYEQLQLAESEEIQADRKYLESTAEALRATGITVQTCLALGNPPGEILKVAKAEQCDLIAMASHGHRFLADIIFGSTINPVRHRSTIPILLVRAT